LTEVVSVRFKNKGKVYFFAPDGCTVKDGDAVIVETSKGLEYAGCTWGNHWVDDSAVVPPLRPVIRVATEADTRRYEENKQKESEAFRICEEKIIARELDMKLVDVEYNFEGSKILFFFTSDGRVDFRELVKDLAGVFHTRIELRQIGVRDEAKMLGGLGICGRPFCCSQFLDDFHPVSIKMAKTQGLSLNPTKISGTCGRLMCCLKYEQFAYEDLVKKAPKMDAFVETPGGKGTVVAINLLRSYAKVKLEDSSDTIPKTYPFDELEVLGGKGRRAEYIAARDSGTLEEAGFTPSQIRKSRLETQPGAQEEEAPFVFADGTTAIARPAAEPVTEKQERNPKTKSRRNRRPQRPQGGDAQPAAQTHDSDEAPVDQKAMGKPNRQARQDRTESRKSRPGDKNAGQRRQGTPGNNDQRKAKSSGPKSQNQSQNAPQTSNGSESSQQGEAKKSRPNNRRRYYGKKKGGKAEGGQTGS